jgi:hypothetical protein
MNPEVVTIQLPTTDQPSVAVDKWHLLPFLLTFHAGGAGAVTTLPATSL